METDIQVRGEESALRFEMEKVIREPLGIGQAQEETVRQKKSAEYRLDERDATVDVQCLGQTPVDLIVLGGLLLGLRVLFQRERPRKELVQRPA